MIKSMHYILTFLLVAGMYCTAVPGALAQVSPDIQVWRHGKVYLANGDSVTGSIMYYRNEEIIKVEQNDGDKFTFSPVNLAGFVVKDEGKLFYREFRTYLWNHTNNPNGYKRPAIFECLEDGAYSLIKRDTYIKADNSKPMLAMGLVTGIPIPIHIGSYHVVEMYYLVSPTDKIIQLKNPKKDLAYVYADAKRAKRLDAFVKENNLSYNKAHDMKAIIRYFNSLL